MATYKSFEELDCWQKCRKVRVWVNHFINLKLRARDWEMTDNLRRAARSITRNIAEGFGRFHFKENIRFCRISRGSLFEIRDDLLICVDENLVGKDDLSDGLELINDAFHSLHGYIKYLKSRDIN